MYERSVNYKFDYIPDIHHRFEGNLLKTFVKGKKVLDIGCWTGQFLSIIEKEADCYGLDPDKSAIKFAKKYRKGYYTVGSALDLPYKDDTFDIVTMWDVIEHIPPNTEHKALKEAARVLKSGGIFALSTVTTHPISILLDPAYFLIGHRHYSQKQLYFLLKNSGFKINKTIYSGGLWTLLRDNINLVVKHIFHSSISLPFIDNLVRGEYKGKGFYQTHILLQKNKS